MKKKPSVIERIFMLNEPSVYKPLLAGACIGGALQFLHGGNFPMAIGGAIGGAIFFAVVWRIARFARRS